MNLFQQIRTDITSVLDGLAAEGTLSTGLDYARIVVEPPRDASHGDVATNVAMVLAKPAGMKPRDLAAPIADRLMALETVSKADIAGPGFINLTLTDDFWRQNVSHILEVGTAYGYSDLGQNRMVNVEYVSANPTARILEGDKERIQVFSGVIIARRGSGTRETFTVRRIVASEGVERTFPVNSPKIAKLEVKRHGVVRRAKLYYLRDRTGKATRLAERRPKKAGAGD